MLLKKSMPRRGRMRLQNWRSPLSARRRQCQCELAEVLDGGGHQELVFRSVRSSEAQAGKPENAFEVSKQHFDLFPGVSRGDIGIARGDLSCQITRTFVYRPRHFACRRLWAASWLQRAGVTVDFGGTVAGEADVLRRRSDRLEGTTAGEQLLAAGTGVAVGLAVVDEVLTRECPVFALRFIDDRNVRLDPFAFHKPAQHLRRPVGRVCHQFLRIEPEPFPCPLDHVHRSASFRLADWRGRRPAWLIRLGLFLYDHLGGRKILPPTGTIDLAAKPEGTPLQDRFVKAFEYSDCWVDDSRLVVLNARDAAARGADIMTRAQVKQARRDGDLWEITLKDMDSGHSHIRYAKMLVNAAGPWVEQVIRGVAGINNGEGVRLVRGSHIVTRRLYEHDKCYFFQGTDGRIIFAIPYQCDFTLIGTTDADHSDLSTRPECTEDEQTYLLNFASQYFKRPVTWEDIVWTYSGVRPLYDDGAGSAAAATREYVLSLDGGDGAPLLNVFGGKITTYRRLAERALDKIAPYFPGMPGAWTAGIALPGGDFPIDGAPDLLADLKTAYPFLDDYWAYRLVHAYGSYGRNWVMTD